MIVPFNEIPSHSKLWIFPSSRKFYPTEIPDIKKQIENFLSKWKNQGEELKCAYLLNYDRFIIITVDTSNTNLTLETHDLLATFIQQLEKKLNVILLDKINVCYKQGDFVQYKDIKDFKQLIKNKGVSKKTTVFNNMITSKDELKNHWEINIMVSWLSHLIKSTKN